MKGLVSTVMFTIGLCSVFTTIIFGVYLLSQVFNLVEVSFMGRLLMSLGVLGYAIIPTYWYIKWGFKKNE